MRRLKHKHYYQGKVYFFRQINVFTEEVTNELPEIFIVEPTKYTRPSVIRRSSVRNVTTLGRESAYCHLLGLLRPPGLFEEKK